MGFFSKINRYRDAGGQTSSVNMEMFGEPVRSLFTTSKVFTLHRSMEITDDQNNVVYRSETQFPSIRAKTDIFDSEGHVIAHIERKVFSLHERRFITMADGTAFELSNELFHLIKDISNIEGLGWQLRGNILGLNFELYDEKGQIVAVISQKLVSLHDKYCVDIYREEDEDIVVAILVSLQHMIRDRQNAAAGSSSSGG